ncbi:EthD family reductase [Sphingomonas paucimobilis]|nr:EthD family reductase [Sphingomonas paucimobilis]
MKKMLALYRAPENVDDFFKHYREVHVPLVRKLPGLADVKITRITRTLVGEPGTFLLAEMSFADEDALKTALRSPENAACGKDAMELAGDLVTVMTGETVEF